MRVSSLLILLLSVLIASAASRTLLDGISQASAEVEQEEHQRILAELEEVHQLRERMLQQGMCVLYRSLLLVSSTSPCLSAPVP